MEKKQIEITIEIEASTIRERLRMALEILTTGKVKTTKSKEEIKMSGIFN